MMRFYGLAYEAVLDLPIRTFWMLNGMIERIRAEESLAIMPAYSATMGGEGVERIIAGFKQTVGNPLIAEQKKMTEQDRETLKTRFGSIGG